MLSTGTDIETIRAMFDRAGIRRAESEVRGPGKLGDDIGGGVTLGPDSHPSWFQASAQWALGARNVISAEAGEGPRNLGYGGFTAELYFDSAGMLVATGAWE